MKRLLILTALVVFLGGFVKTANSYDCEDGGVAVGFVSQVRYNPGASSVWAAVQGCTCQGIIVQESSGVTENAVRGAQALLLTALTTGLPIKFTVASGSGDNCIVSEIVIAKPGT